MDQRDPVLRAVAACLQVHTSPQEGVAAAVSGGADSLALALAIAEIATRRGQPVSVLHIDHGLRPESAAEAQRVEAWARVRGLPFATERVQVEREGGLEAAARRARYAALERLAGRLEMTWLATGHTASDQAETVLLRLGRGAGLRGARGVLERRGHVLRPLLSVGRSEVMAFLERRGERPLVEDPSNRDVTRARNRIRHNVLPELRLALGPGVDRALARFAALAREDEQALETWAQRASDTRAELRALPEAVLRRWLRQRSEALGYPPNSTELRAASRAVRAPGAKRLELGRRVRVEIGERVELGPAGGGETDAPEVLELRAGEPLSLAWAGGELLLEPVLNGAPREGEVLLPGSTAFPLRVRAAKQGDRIALEHGHAKVGRLLMDRKVLRSERWRVPLVVDARGEVLWVVGFRISAKVRLEPGQRAEWRLRWQPAKPHPTGQANAPKAR